MQTQAYPRYKKRVPCRFDVGETNHQGLVLNLSHGGLFVSSRVAAKVGSRVVLHLSPAGETEAIPVSARVVWNRKLHAGMANLKDPGIGVEILESDDAYLRLVNAASSAPGSKPMGARAPAAARPSVAAPPGRSFQVRLARIGSPRTRFLEVRAEDEAGARSGALDELGEGWEVMEVQG